MLYESYFETPESVLFNYVWTCIENSYPNKIDLTDLIRIAKKDNEELNKESWIRIIIGCLTYNDKQQVGTLFINEYLRGEKNKYFFAFLHKKLTDIVEGIANSLKAAFNL